MPIDRLINMKTTRNRYTNSWKHQQGVTLIEMLVAVVISLIAVSGMVLVMATTLGTSTQTIEMARLTQEMRTAMQIMTRELRRANYHPGFIACLGNTGCLGNTTADDLNIDTWVKQVQLGDSVGSDDCLWFWYDRPQFGELGVDEPVAAFRRTENADEIGIIQMTTTRSETSDPTCNTDADNDDWVDITDPNIIDVLTFTITNTESYVETISEVGGATQTVDKIGLTIEAKLTVDASVPVWIQNQNDAGPTRELDDFVKVRNKTIAP